VKALCLGADCVMMGSMLAGTEESPGQILYKDGIRLKAYRGMGSKAASNVKTMASKSRYCDNNTSSVFVEQGVSGTVVSKGSVKTYVPYMRKAVMHGMQDIGVKSVYDAQTKSADGTIRMELRSTGSQREGMVHDLYSYEK
jgi:IMP dehydrogenase